MSMTRAVGLLLAVAGCGAPTAPPPTGGTDQVAGSCGRGFVVVNVDEGYQSASVSLLDTEGAVLSPRFISSASTEAGLTAPLSGDVVVPLQRRDGAEVLLIDRYPASVLTWVEVTSGEVRAQLDVRTGFVSNPQDALALDDGRLYVSRYEPNQSPGQEPFDAGSDLLVVDPAAPTIVGRVDLSPAMAGAGPTFRPHPNRLVGLDEHHVAALLAAYEVGYTDAAPSRLAIVDVRTDTVVGHHVLPLRGCTTLSRIDDARYGVGCTGIFEGSTVPDLSTGGIVVVDYADGAFREVQRWTGDELGGPVGQNLDHVAGRLLTVTFGEDGASSRPDRFIAVDVATREVSVVRESQARPFVLGDVRCATDPQGAVPHSATLDGPACGACFLTDAEAGVIHRYAVEGDTLVPAGEVDVDDGIGLPPRYLGRF